MGILADGLLSSLVAPHASGSIRDVLAQDFDNLPHPSSGKKIHNNFNKNIDASNPTECVTNLD